MLIGKSKIFLKVLIVAIFVLSGQQHAAAQTQSQGNASIENYLKDIASEPLPEKLTASDGPRSDLTRELNLVKIEGRENQYRRADGEQPQRIYYVQRDSLNPNFFEITKREDYDSSGNITKTLETKTSAEVQAEAEEFANKRSGFELEIECPTTITNWFAPFACLMTKMSYSLMVYPATALVTISGRSFNYVVEGTIVNMKTNVFGVAGNINGSVIAEGWRIFRDIANILFIFVLLYAGINMILKGVSASAELIKNVIIVAVLINFSLFITNIVIDVSNVIALSFYEEIRGNNETASYGIAEKFLSATGVSSVLGTPDNTQQISNQFNNGQITYLGILKQALFGSVILVIVAIVLFIMSIMLLSRFLILMVIMMTSALAFGAYILPKSRSQITEPWQKALFGQAMFAPVFMVLFWISFKFIDGLKQTSLLGQPDWSNVLAAQPSTIIGYFLIIGMIIVSLKVSKQLADSAGNGAKSVNKWVGGAAIGTAAWAGRQGFGRLASSASKLMGDPKTARGLYLKNRLESIKNSSFDLRNSKTFASITKQSGVDFGSKSKESYSSYATKRDEKARKSSQMISNEVDPNDPQGRTYREIYDSSWTRYLHGSGSRPAVRRSIKKAEGDLAQKNQAVKLHEQRVAKALKDAGHDTHKKASEQASEQIGILNTAMATAIANGDQTRINSIKQQIDAQKKIKKDSEDTMKTIQETVDNSTVNGRTMKEEGARLAKEVEKANKKVKELDKDKEISNKDLLKQLEELNKKNSKSE